MRKLELLCEYADCYRLALYRRKSQNLCSTHSINLNAEENKQKDIYNSAMESIVEESESEFNEIFGKEEKECVKCLQKYWKHPDESENIKICEYCKGEQLTIGCLTTTSYYQLTGKDAFCICSICTEKFYEKSNDIGSYICGSVDCDLKSFICINFGVFLCYMHFKDRLYRLGWKYE